MNVSELQTLLTELASLLRVAGAESKAGDLETFCRELKPHKSKTLSELLTAGAAPTATKTPPANGGARGPNKAQKIETLLVNIASMYQNARDPSISRERIDAAFAELAALDPSGKKLEELGAQLDVTEKKLKKGVLIGKLRQSVLNRKADAERTLQ